MRIVVVTKSVVRDINCKTKQRKTHVSGLLAFINAVQSGKIEPEHRKLNNIFIESTRGNRMPSCGFSQETTFYKFNLI